MSEPLLYLYACQLYDALVEHSKNGRFEGSKVGIFRSLNISQTHYTPLYGALAELGCIEQLRRGNAAEGSLIVLHHRPELEEFQQIYRSTLTKPDRYDTLETRVRAVEQRLASIEATLSKGTGHLTQGGNDGETKGQAVNT